MHWLTEITKAQLSQAKTLFITSFYKTMKIGEKVNLGNFGQVRASLGNFGQVWTSSGKFGQVRTSLGKFGQVRTRQQIRKMEKKGTKI